MAIKLNYLRGAENVVAVQTSKEPIEQQILAAGNLSEAQVEAIRGFQRRKGLTFGGKRRSRWALVRRDSLFLGPSETLQLSGSEFRRRRRPLFPRVGRRLPALQHGRRSLPFGTVGARNRALVPGKNAFAVIGPHRRVGITYFAANLALSFAQMAVPTLLVDANLRKPRLAALFGVGTEYGRGSRSRP